MCERYKGVCDDFLISSMQSEMEQILGTPTKRSPKAKAFQTALSSYQFRVSCLRRDLQALTLSSPVPSSTGLLSNSLGVAILGGTFTHIQDPASRVPPLPSPLLQTVPGDMLRTYTEHRSSTQAPPGVRPQLDPPATPKLEKNDPLDLSCALPFPAVRLLGFVVTPTQAPRSGTVVIHCDCDGAGAGEGKGGINTPCSSPPAGPTTLTLASSQSSSLSISTPPVPVLGLGVIWAFPTIRPVSRALVRGETGLGRWRWLLAEVAVVVNAAAATDEVPMTAAEVIAAEIGLEVEKMEVALGGATTVVVAGKKSVEKQPALSRNAFVASNSTAVRAHIQVTTTMPPIRSDKVKAVRISSDRGTPSARPADDWIWSALDTARNAAMINDLARVNNALTMLCLSVLVDVFRLFHLSDATHNTATCKHPSDPNNGCSSPIHSHDLEAHCAELVGSPESVYEETWKCGQASSERGKRE
ncbi:hypothetical protein F5887DRAFT_1161501 [Amanita rubescens]|nr:hypothetical protein F5887DRAFT_1161501 [Amanita rubescens]